ncbi:hypothetical protein CIK05_08645 [Bdellovibrio sp. qaytius]|nr:hypothetical protein CIK05_08645 [Bdellovibrio sp. qaytius]
MFKKIVCAATVLMTLTGLGAKASDRFSRDKVIIIEAGSESRSSRRDLEKRIYRLEQAVRQLQDRVFDLETENDDLKKEDPNVKKFTCYIKTNSKGIFSSTQKSQTQAKAEVMQKCSEVIRFGFECDEEKVKCGE